MANTRLGGRRVRLIKIFGIATPSRNEQTVALRP